MKLPFNGWVYSGEAMESAMPGIHSVGQAFLHYPLLCLKHVASNVLDFPKPLLQALVLHEPLVLPGAVFHVRSIEVFCFVSFLVVLVWKKRERAQAAWREWVASPAVRDPHLALWLDRGLRIRFLSPYALAPLLFFLTPVVSSRWITPDTLPRRIHALVETIRRIPLPRSGPPLRIAGNSTYLSAYLGVNFRSWPNEPVLRQLIETPQQLGYTRFNTRCGTVILARSRLLPHFKVAITTN